MKIAMIGHKRIPSREGGVEIVVEELATRMVEAGHDVTCYNRGGHHVSGKEFDANSLDADVSASGGASSFKGIRLKKVPTIDAKGLAAVTSSFFASIAATFSRYDVVHYHAEGPCFFMWIPRLFRKRCVATIHGLDWQRAKWQHGFGAKYIKWGEKAAVKWAHEIIVLSKGVQDYFAETYGRETTFIPNGVSKPVVMPAELITQKFGLTKDEYILFLGRIVPEKGVKYLIEAFKNVRTDKKLVIAGGSSDTEDFYQEMQTLAAEDDRIIFTGFVSGQTLEELYSNAYIYTLPSDLEGMPLSLLEAMSYGNCCLTSNIPECADVLDGHGVTFLKGDVRELTEVLQRLVYDSENVNNIRQGVADFVTERYGWEKVVEDTVRIYEGA